MGLLVFLAAYLLGGLTFIPFLISIGIVWGTKKVNGNGNGRNEEDKEGNITGDGGTDGIKTGADSSWGDEGLGDARISGLGGLKRRHVPDVAAGYFAVCREYVPGGINGKPPERTTPAGSVIATESPSVYQSMYRSIFDRNKSFTPTLEGANGKSKKARNVFYVVLRLGHLMLYDDSEQLEVRHVISLTHYDVSVYSGGNPIPEGELWIKRNCIRLTQRPQSTNIHSDSKPYYIFSENCSDKEDFYHAMLQSLERGADAQENPPPPLKFNTSDLVKLVQQLHASEENLHTRWINALIGRLFLALYKTPAVENHLWTKITKKIARVPKPALITSIKLQRIDMGDLPPFITNPKLKELTVDGDLVVEADVSYKGNLCLEISAIARIELGSRFKAREVTLVLASILKSLEGHVLVRIKPPPSNRMWITFETPPKMEMSLEPIVSSRQITYGVILRAIESRIREVVSETLVLPNWDDIPFSNTILDQFRGGLWDNGVSDAKSGLPRQEVAEQFDREKETEYEDLESSNVASSEATRSVPTLRETVTLATRRPLTPSSTVADNESTGTSSAIDIRTPPPKPKAMRSGSFASVASPVVNTNPANAPVSSSEERKRSSDATSAMKTTISRSQPTSPAESPVGSPAQPSVTRQTESRRSTSPATFQGADRVQRNDFDPPPIVVLSTTPDLPSDATDMLDSTTETPLKSRHGSSASLPRNTFGSSERKQTFNQSLNSATAVAKKWLASRQNPDGPASPNAGGLFSRPSNNNSNNNNSNSNTSGTPEDTINDFLNGGSAQPSPKAAGVEASAPLGSPAHPIGRGQPLPPPGTPLPHPPKKTWGVPAAAATFANLTKRKPTNTRQQPPHSPQPPHLHGSESIFESSSSLPLTGTQHSTARDSTTSISAESDIKPGRKPSSSSTQSINPAPPPLPKRRQRISSVTDAADRHSQGPESLFVVEAPPQDNSAPTSPTDADADVRVKREESMKVSKDWESGHSGRSERSAKSNRDRVHGGGAKDHGAAGGEAVEEDEGNVFPAMDMDG